MAGGGQGVGATWEQFQSDVMSSGNAVVMVARWDTMDATELALKMVMMVKSTLCAFTTISEKAGFCGRHTWKTRTHAGECSR